MLRRFACLFSRTVETACRLVVRRDSTNGARTDETHGLRSGEVRQLPSGSFFDILNDMLNKESERLRTGLAGEAIE